MDTSPAQKLMGRRCKTLLPTTAALLQPRYDTDEDALALLGQKEKQRHHYDKNARTLEPLSPGDGLRLRLPGKSTWSRGICKQEESPRSYIVVADGRTYRRNRRDLRKTDEEQLPNTDAQRSNRLATSTNLRRSNRVSRPPTRLIDNGQNSTEGS